MSRVISSKKHVFATGLGVVLVDTQDVEEYDVEDIIADRAASQAEIIQLENIASNIDVNASKYPRQIAADAYL